MAPAVPSAARWCSTRSVAGAVELHPPPHPTTTALGGPGCLPATSHATQGLGNRAMGVRVCVRAAYRETCSRVTEAGDGAVTIFKRQA